MQTNCLIHLDTLDEWPAQVKQMQRNWIGGPLVLKFISSKQLSKTT